MVSVFSPQVQYQLVELCTCAINTHMSINVCYINILTFQRYTVPYLILHVNSTTIFSSYMVNVHHLSECTLNQGVITETCRVVVYQVSPEVTDSLWSVYCSSSDREFPSTIVIFYPRASQCYFVINNHFGSVYCEHLYTETGMSSIGSFVVCKWVRIALWLSYSQIIGLWITFDMVKLTCSIIYSANLVQDSSVYILIWQTRAESVTC